MAVYLVALLQHDNDSQRWAIWTQIDVLAKGGGEGGNDQEERRSKGCEP